MEGGEDLEDRETKCREERGDRWLKREDGKRGGIIRGRRRMEYRGERNGGMVEEGENSPGQRWEWVIC